jgi:ABC-2 type transport system ATP-binding protein
VQTLISVKSLRVDYEGVTAVWDLNLEIPQGTIFGLVGPNGAGKTSTIKAIAGIVEPSYGEIHLCGMDTELQREEAWRHLGYLPDFPPFYENLTVKEYLGVFATAYLLPREKRESQARYWVGRLGLEGKWDAIVRDLSRGMRQRLGFAKTLLHDPSVLLLDEPASGLDPISRREQLELLKDLAQSGKSILISSHVLTELSDLCNAVGIMEKGRMVVAGSLEEVRDRTGSRKHLRIGIVGAKAGSRDDLLQHATSFGAIRNPRLTEEPATQSVILEAAFDGDEKEAAQILKSLIEKNFLVHEFHLQQENIEDIFLKVGAREVS